MNPSARFVSIGLVTIGLFGCATPQPVLDEANNGAALTALFQVELRQFRQVQAAVAQARLESIRRQETRLATYEQSAAFEERVQMLAGRGNLAAMYQTLRDLAESRRKDSEAFTARMDALNASLATVVSPLPVVDDKLAATQQALAVMGEELSLQKRLQLAAAFAKDVADAIKKERDAANEAMKSAPSAPAQGAAPTASSQ